MLISTSEEFVSFLEQSKNNRKINAELTADIDLSRYDGIIFPDVSSVNECYSGNFNGCGHIISGINIPYSQRRVRTGIFGMIGRSGVVKNLTIRGTINGRATVGSICGINKGTIENCTVECEIQGNSCTSGIASINYGIITDCSFKGNINLNRGRGGGICCENMNIGILKNNVNYGWLSDDTGAFICRYNNGLIIDCVNQTSQSPKLANVVSSCGIVDDIMCYAPGGLLYDKEEAIFNILKVLKRLLPTKIISIMSTFDVTYLPEFIERASSAIDTSIRAGTDLYRKADTSAITAFERFGLQLFSHNDDTPVLVLKKILVSCPSMFANNINIERLMPSGHEAAERPGNRYNDIKSAIREINEYYSNLRSLHNLAEQEFCR